MRGWRVRSVPKRFSSTKALGSPRRTLSQHKGYRVVTAPRAWGRCATPYPSRRSKVPRSSTYPPLRGLGAAHKIEADLQLPFFPKQRPNLDGVPFRRVEPSNEASLWIGDGTRPFAERPRQRPPTEPNDRTTLRSGLCRRCNDGDSFQAPTWLGCILSQGTTPHLGGDDREPGRPTFLQLLTAHHND
jgi:hypothetical protein